MKKGYLYLILMLSVSCLSTSAIFVRLAGAPASVTAFWRLFLTLLMILPLLVFNRKERAAFLGTPRRVLIAAMLSGVFLAVHFVLWFESLSLTSVASSTVIVTLQPIFTMLFAFLFRKEKESRTGLIGCLIAISGSAVIGWGDFRVGGTAFLGDLIALTAAAFISFYFFLGENIRSKMTGTGYSVAAFTGSTLFLLIYALIKGDPLGGYPEDTWWSFLGLAFVSTVLGQFVFNMLLRWLSATSITMGVLGEPVGTAILSYFILSERIEPRQWIGMAVILAGLFLYFSTKRKEA